MACDNPYETRAKNMSLFITLIILDFRKHKNEHILDCEQKSVFVKYSEILCTLLHLFYTFFFQT